MTDSLSTENRQNTPTYTYTIVPGFFAQSDPNTNDTTFPEHPDRFGLVDDSSNCWETFKLKIAELNKVAHDKGEKSEVKFILFQRHGQGYHNLAEIKYGKKLWDEYYSRQPEYFDPTLTDLGIIQIKTVNEMLKKESRNGFPQPEYLISSPLSRCLNTTLLAYDDVLIGEPQPNPAQVILSSQTRRTLTPYVHEIFREQYGDHTCDARRSRTELQSLFPQFDYCGLFSEKDELWTPEREADQHVNERMKKGLDWIFSTRKDTYIGLVGHGGVVEGLIAATGHRDFKLLPGGFLPMVIKAEWE
ncbi:hypothetical protein HDV00_011158 [Rhizophlyctis rosea]|nr:hypothetical protein HDV00_011158 [Rhizophlyctis rosea]